MESAPPNQLYFEDLTVGRRFQSGEHTVTAEAIVAFARQFDPQPFHLDAEAAKDSIFAGLAASGWHTAAITMKLIVGDEAPIAGGVIGAGVELNWPRPTRPGDVLRVESEVVEVKTLRSRSDRGMVRLRACTMNQNGEVVQEMLSWLVAPCRAPLPAQFSK